MEAICVAEGMTESSPGFGFAEIGEALRHIGAGIQPGLIIVGYRCNPDSNITTRFPLIALVDAT